ncbi:MAG: hypothetical protein K0S14_2119 [Thermomicrobiales bacterium]|nr:hypothetical protein [Thermomicrobiales bacterium]
MLKSGAMTPYLAPSTTQTEPQRSANWRLSRPQQEAVTEVASRCKPRQKAGIRKGSPSDRAATGRDHDEWPERAFEIRWQDMEVTLALTMAHHGSPAASRGPTGSAARAISLASARASLTAVGRESARPAARASASASDPSASRTVARSWVCRSFSKREGRMPTVSKREGRMPTVSRSVSTAPKRRDATW